jgi:DNA-binding NtrC family response regulator
MIITRGDSIAAEDLPLRPLQATGAPSAASLAEMEKAAIVSALDRNRGDRKSTASELGISLRTLQYRLKEYGLAGRDRD